MLLMLYEQVRVNIQCEASVGVSQIAGQPYDVRTMRNPHRSVRCDAGRASALE